MSGTAACCNFFFQTLKKSGCVASTSVHVHFAQAGQHCCFAHIPQAALDKSLSSFSHLKAVDSDVCCKACGCQSCHLLGTCCCRCKERTRLPSGQSSPRVRMQMLKALPAHGPWWLSTLSPENSSTLSSTQVENYSQTWSYRLTLSRDVCCSRITSPLLALWQLLTSCLLAD